MAEMPMVLLNCRTALVSSLVVKRKNDHITMQWCETPSWFSVQTVWANTSGRVAYVHPIHRAIRKI